MLARTLALAFGLIGAIAASQAPEFAQQYRQRLGGAIDELRRVVDSFDRDARSSGLERREALERMARSADDLQRRHSVSVTGQIMRLQLLQSDRDALRDAGPFLRLIVFASRADSDIARRAFDDFEPAVPTTAEGAVAAGAGFVAGWGLTRLLARLFRKRRPEKTVRA
ncbi:MAG: DUF2937 family protein [Beijerinckiaceae bacterium]